MVVLYELFQISLTFRPSLTCRFLTILVSPFLTRVQAVKRCFLRIIFKNAGIGFVLLARGLENLS